MTIAEAAFLGLVQGLTEFLPISSSGHLALFQQLLGANAPGVTFDVAVHVGTLVAVLWVYRRDIGGMLGDAFWVLGRGLGAGGWRGAWRRQGWRLLVLVVIGSLPTAVIGLAFEGVFTGLFDNLRAVGWFWLLTGTLLWLGDRLAVQDRRLPIEEAGVGTALFMGLMQGLAIAPGISRSGSTIVGGLLMGLEATAAAKISFLLSLPAIAGAAILDLPQMLGSAGQAVGAGALLVGSGTAAVSGVLAIRLLLSLLQTGRFRIFAWYTWALGLLVLLVLT